MFALTILALAIGAGAAPALDTCPDPGCLPALPERTERTAKGGAQRTERAYGSCDVSHGTP